MSESIAIHAEGSFRERKDVIGVSSRPAHQAYQILHITYAVVPIITGLDKFFHLLCNWDHYLAPLYREALARWQPQSDARDPVWLRSSRAWYVAFKPSSTAAYLVAAVAMGIVINLLNDSRLLRRCVP